MRRKPQRRAPTSRATQAAVSRQFFVAHLHRPPCRWDVLVHELSLALAKVLAKAGRRLAADTFVFRGPDAQTAGWILAKGFDVLLSQNWPRAEGSSPVSLWPLTADAAVCMARQTAELCFGPLLRKYVWDSKDRYAGGSHRDLPPLTSALSQGLKEFLIGRCLPGGDLAGCLSEPLADSDAYFPADGRPRVLAASSGEPCRDVQRLALTLADHDGGSEVKRKLVHLVRDDPWLYAEWRSFVESRQKEQGETAAAELAMAFDQATDDFIFRATRLDGMTPIQLLLERQRDLADCQRQRLLRWDAEAYQSAFHIREIIPPRLRALDIGVDRELFLEATRPEALASMRPGDLLLSRVVPWDDHWLLSGVVQRYEQVSVDRVQEIMKALRRKPSHRPFDPGDPRIAQAFGIQEQQHEAWLTLFGSEEVLFADGLELGAAMHRFYRYWAEMILPDTGLTRMETFRRQHGKEPPSQKFPLPDDLLRSRDVAAVFDRRHGMSFLVRYGVFLSAFESDGPLSDVQVECVWFYLCDGSTQYWVFQRMAERYPDRTEAVLRAATRDSTFLLRDLDVLLRRFKGEAMRKPVRPMVTMVDLSDERDCKPGQTASP